MVTVYSVALVVGVLGLIVMLFSVSLVDDSDRELRGLRAFHTTSSKIGVGAFIGFGMGGMAAEFSPLELSWWVSLLLALLAAGLAVVWVRYASSLGKAT